MTSIAVTDDTFETEVLKSDQPVVVDFWAEWCGPCKQLTPLIDELATEMGDKVKIVKVNIDDAPEAPTKYGVRGVPTLMVFKGGEMVASRVGGLPKTQLSEWIEENA